MRTEGATYAWYFNVDRDHDELERSPLAVQQRARSAGRLIRQRPAHIPSVE
ncbi:hypothetical protein [Streptomyces sp. NPDC046385]|uniref:hypothetical protein n=1 Tax=Streptomyces sp. NPDC046385 TaxID=3154918 RepID=UPI0033E588C8